ncbi:MAG: ABC transporter permease, partial [Gluconacetobacter sp.]
MNSTDRGPEWSLEASDTANVIVLSGDWIAQQGHVPDFPSDGLRQARPGQKLTFRTDRLGRWDTGLIGFLWALKQGAAQAHLEMDADTLPDAAHKLLDLLP